MTQTYEAMVLVSNQVVREDWRKAKSLVAEMLTKHEGSIKTLRRYEERRLAYPIKGNLRATYYLTYFEMPGANVPALRRDMELSESVLRNLVLAVDAVPEEEIAQAALEEDADYTVPEPPADDEPDVEEVSETEDEDIEDEEEVLVGDGDDL
ncbi:MAG: 30S ribosomal protein S6 [Planctomycetes bacterium]|nr:30S ribosomal protein S6 [Planctomycetota bacterium]MCB9910879.1 30S ribosomal protein S6 [Planctomycetota bacterium]MCB9912090.1 30S ribosomal protein S6 [Planctomycetota bacterium]HRV80537.1 30S ribosomal protein S6 [Planctomycetota bacterium]